MNILTFNIGDWFHSLNNRHLISGHIWSSLPSKLEDNIIQILELLEELNIKSTFFVLGWVAEKQPAIIKRIHSHGHEIGAFSHWYHEANRLVPEDFEKDLVRVLSVLSDLTGNKIIAYRSPGCNLKLSNKLILELLFSHGITVDSSIKVNKSEFIPSNIPVLNDSILEFPLLKSKIGIDYGSGGFFRAFPSKYINYQLSRHEYNMLHFYPRDFEVGRLYSNLFSLKRNMLNTYNTKNCIFKLRSFLKENETITIGEAAEIFYNK